MGARCVGRKAALDISEKIDVYFDDFNVHVKREGATIIQEDSYYPFGLTFNSWQREGSLENNFQYNGKESLNELGLGWIDYGARMYDPSIGKWNGIDPLTELYNDYSPYHYVLNNPMRYKDLFGMGAEEKGKEEEKKEEEKKEEEEDTNGKEDKKKDNNDPKDENGGAVDTVDELVKEVQKKIDEIKTLQKESERINNDEKLNTIYNKVKNGEELNEEEKSYLFKMRVEILRIGIRLDAIRYEQGKIKELINATKARNQEINDKTSTVSFLRTYANELISGIPFLSSILSIDVPPGDTTPVGEAYDKVMPYPKGEDQLPYPLKYD